MLIRAIEAAKEQWKESQKGLVVTFMEIPVNSRLTIFVGPVGCGKLNYALTRAKKCYDLQNILHIDELFTTFAPKQGIIDGEVIRDLQKGNTIIFDNFQCANDTTIRFIDKIVTADEVNLIDFLQDDIMKTSRAYNRTIKINPDFKVFIMIDPDE